MTPGYPLRLFALTIISFNIAAAQAEKSERVRAMTKISLPFSSALTPMILRRKLRWLHATTWACM